MPRPPKRILILGKVAAVLLALFALVYGVLLVALLADTFRPSRLTLRDWGLTAVMLTLCPAMVAAALLNARHMLRLGTAAAREPRLLRPGLWLITLSWSSSWLAGLIWGAAGSDVQSVLITGIFFATPAWLALACLWVLHRTRLTFVNEINPSRAQQLPAGTRPCQQDPS